jgi:hypothetical protein
MIWPYDLAMFGLSRLSSALRRVSGAAATARIYSQNVSFRYTIGAAVTGAALRGAAVRVYPRFVYV